MAEEKVIKTGVLTLPRLLFLAAVGLLISLTVWRGGIWLTIGYWLMTVGLCGLLVLIVIDYGVKKEAMQVGAGSDQAGTPDTQATAPTVVSSASAARVRRRASRPTKRRR